MVKEIRQIPIRSDSVFLVTVGDEWDDIDELYESFGQLSEDANVYVILLRDKQLQDFRQLSLAELIELNGRIEEIISDLSRGTEAEA